MNQNFSSTPLSRVVSDPPSESVKSSNFHILINTNHQYKNAESMKDGIRCLYKSLNLIFCDPASLKDIIKINTDKRPGTTFETDIGRIVTEISIEYAKSGLHAHALMQVTHLTFIHVNLPEINTKFITLYNAQNPSIPLKGAYIHVDHIRDNLGNVRDYIYKHIGANRKIRMRRGWDYPEKQEIRAHIVITNMVNSFSQESSCTHDGTVPLRSPA